MGAKRRMEREGCWLLIIRKAKGNKNRKFIKNVFVAFL